MPLPPNDYVTMFSILLAFLYLTVSTKAFEIHVPYLVFLNQPATAAWTRNERDQGDFVFLLRSLQSGESERLSDVPNNLSSGTISLNFTHPGCYEVGIGRPDTDHIAIRIGTPVLVLEIDGILNIPCKIETHNPKPSASSPPPDTALSSTTSNSATTNRPYHVSSFSAFPTSDSSLSSSTVASSSSIPISTDTHSSSSIVSPTSRYGTAIPSSGTSTSSSSDALSTGSQSPSFSSSSASRTANVSSSIAVTSSSSSLILANSQSVSSSPSSATGSVSVSSTATSSQSVSNSSSATSSPVPSISISSSLSSNATDSDGSVPTMSFTGLSSTSQQFLQVTQTSTIDITATSTGIATSPTDGLTSGTLSSAPSSQVANSPSSMTVSSTPSQGVTSELPSHSFTTEPSPKGATGYTSLTTIPSSTSVIPPVSTSYSSDSMEETRLHRILGGVFTALSILLVILGLVLCRRHRRLKARTRDIEAYENFNRRSGSLLTRPSMAGTQTSQSFSNAYTSSRISSIDSIDEIVRLLDPSGHATGPEYARTTAHESHESDHLTRRESSDIASEHSYHSLTSNPFLDPPEGPLLPELPLPNAVKRKSSVVQSPARSATQRSNGTTDSGTSRKTSRPESYFFMFVDGVMQPLDSRSDRYRSLVLSSECSFLMPDQVVLQERADALHEEIVWLRRKVTSLPSDKGENEELLATIRMREENLKRLNREIEGEARQRQSDSFPPFSRDDMVTDYSRISR